jgi:hypothetical protein
LSFVSRYSGERIYLSNTADPLPLNNANICIDGSTQNGGKVTVSRPSATSNADHSVFLFFNDPNLLSGGKPQPAEFCLYNLAIEGGYSAITDQVDLQSRPQFASSFVQMDVVNCHFEDQGNDSIRWNDVTVSLLRVVGSTFFDCGDDFVDVQIAGTDGYNANKIEIVNSHFEKSGGECVSIDGPSPPTYNIRRRTNCLMSSFYSLNILDALI